MAIESRVSSVGVTTYYRLDDRRIGVRFPIEERYSSILRSTQNVSGARITSYPVGSMDSSSRGESGGSVKLTIHFYLVLRLGTHGSIPPLSHSS
jgi:hypothetical protein